MKSRNSWDFRGYYIRFYESIRILKSGTSDFGVSYYTNPREFNDFILYQILEQYNIS